MWVWMIACGEAPESGGPGKPDPEPTEPSTTSSSSEPPPTGTTTPTDDCPSAEGLGLALSVNQPWSAHEVELEVTLDAPATVAVTCTLDADADEVHLVEGTVAASAHTLRLAGLLPDSAYTCAAVAVCPSVSEPVTAPLVTAQPPRRVPSLEVELDAPGAGDDYVLANSSDDCDWETQQLAVFDREGRARWTYATPSWVGPSVEFRHHGEDLFSWGGGWGANPNGRPRTMDLYDGELLDSALGMPDVASSYYHHDGKLLDDGRFLTLEEVSVDDGDESFTGFRVRRVDPVTNTVDFEYHSQRAVDEGHLPPGYGDAWHANWMDIATVDGEEVLYVSLCFEQEVIAIDVATGEWRWTFGRDGDFELLGKNGQRLGRDEFPQCQHGAESSGDRLLVYDNGVDRGFSRATEYTIDEAAGEMQVVWTWTEPDWWETTLGDADWMDSGHVFLTMGHADCFSSNPGDHTTFVELDPTTGEKVWEGRYAVSERMAYRGDTTPACDLFANAKYCDEVRTRLTELGLPRR